LETLTVIESCNFQDHPTGGNLQFVKLIIRLFSPDLILVGLTTDKKHKIGKWTTLNIEGHSYNFFPAIRSYPGKKSIIPARIKMYFGLLYYKRRILRKCTHNVITGTPEAIGVFYNVRNLKIFHFLHGTGNALTVSRYVWARPFDFLYDKWLIPKIARAYKILAAADGQSIEELEKRSRGLIKAKRIVQFPIRVDDTIFKKMDKNEQRDNLMLQKNDVIVITCGRLIKFKGWKFLIDSFKLFKEKYKNATFYFIGDGDDYNKILKYSSAQDLKKNVILTGRKDAEEIAIYLNAGDLFVMGSVQEGWSTTLVEAVCCGVPCVVTNFSSAKEIITNGLNGYVVEDRDPVNFSNRMMDALLLDLTILPTKEIERFGLKTMEHDLLQMLND